jgi:ABC-type transport system substrate-binding protein
MGSDFAGLYLSDVVGAQAVMDGKARTAKGVTAHGQVLTNRLTEPAPDILTRLALPPFCPVPVNLAHDPAGVDFAPSTGPYRIASRVVDQRIVLVRNPYYHGARPRGAARIVVTIGGTDDSDVAAVESGAADYATDVGGGGGPFLDTPTLQRLVAKYGVNRGRFFFEPTISLSMFVLNTAHGIFARNPSLRRAVNFAVDRHALAATFGYLGVKRTFQMLPRGVPGHVNSHLYPVKGPDFARARALAKGHLAGGKAVMYAPDKPSYHQRAEILAYDLGKIGIHVDVRYVPPGLYYGEVGDNPKGYDIATEGWDANYDDPDFFLPFFLGSNYIGGANLSLLDDPALDRAMAAATGLPAPARYTAFGKLDIQVMRDLAPVVPYANPAAYFLVSKRVGCVTTNPVFFLDYAALCLRKRV